MSFVCENCSKAQPSGTKPRKKIVQTREKMYKKNGEVIGWGSEIVREMDLCKPCDELPHLDSVVGIAIDTETRGLDPSSPLKTSLEEQIRES